VADNYNPLQEDGRCFISEEDLAEASRAAITNLKAETTEARVMKKTTQSSPEFRGQANCRPLQFQIEMIQYMVDQSLIDKMNTVLDVMVNG
jgi:hypothetical protein